MIAAEKTLYHFLKAAAQLYGQIPLPELLGLYNGYYTAMDADTFLRSAQALIDPHSPFLLLNEQHILSANEMPNDWKLVDRHFAYAIWDALFTLEYAQEGIPLCRLSHAEFLRYADVPYDPAAIETSPMYDYLEKEVRYPYGLQALLEETILQAISDNLASTCMQELQRMGAVFGDLQKRREFVRLYQDIYNTVRKPSLRGHTEQELMQLPLPQHIKQRYILAWFCPPTKKRRPISDAVLLQNAEFCGASMRQMAYENAMQSQNLPPPLYAPCPCNSGIVYAHCCGKR